MADATKGFTRTDDVRPFFTEESDPVKRAAAVTWLYDRWSTWTLGARPPVYRSGKGARFVLLKRAARKGWLDDDLRARLVADYETCPPGPRRRFEELLVLDPGTSADVLRKIQGTLRLTDLETVLRHPNATPDLIHEVLSGRRGRQVAEQLVGSGNTSRAMLHTILTSEVAAEYLAGRIVAHRHSNSETWMMAIEAFPYADVARALIRRGEEALADPLVKEFIEGSRAIEARTYRLQDADPEAYAEILRALARQSPTRAVEATLEAPPPDGLVLSSQTVATLMTADTPELRRHVMTDLMPHMRGGGVPRSTR